ncbi:xanthine dehydrogenase accessory protein XdhC [Marinicella sediminis]|uniref:Xanthine dehydrogenase accessory protein XdhC n=1 Tax=Marinicella sediminis TaxID=1792834 RepID=A0ABV7J8M4_9GAMM|nr:xanthine dehydrogenase accessory protein XdhC [Marinicella sediminis]
MSQDIYRQIVKLQASAEDFVLVTVVSMAGSAPQEPGAKMLVTKASSERPLSGTVGGGKLEWFALKQALSLLNDPDHPSTLHVSLNLQTDLGMTCGGVVQLFFEKHLANAWEVAVFGAGHVAQSLIPVLLTLDCRLHCFDDRPEWLNQLPDSPRLNKHLLSDWSAPVTGLSAACFLISVTQGHCEDLAILSQLLKERKPPYVGIIGSDSKAARIRKQLRQSGVSEQLVEGIHCPIGLSVGQDIPAEIAISIAAQLLQVKDQLD